MSVLLLLIARDLDHRFSSSTPGVVGDGLGLEAAEGVRDQHDSQVARPAQEGAMSQEGLTFVETS